MLLKRFCKTAVAVMAFAVMLSLPLSAYASDLQKTNAETVRAEGDGAFTEEAAETTPAETGTEGVAEGTAAPGEDREEGAKDADPSEEITEDRAPSEGSPESTVSPEDVPESTDSPGDVPDDSDSPGDVPDDTDSPGDVPEDTVSPENGAQPPAPPEDDISEGPSACGENAFWTLDENGTLTISGTGSLYTYTNVDEAPWFKQKPSVRKVVIEEGIVNIGSHSFIHYNSLESVEIPLSLKSIEAYTFSYDDIKEVNYPGTKTQWDRIAIVRTGNHRFLKAKLKCRIAALKQAQASLSRTSYAYNGKEKKPVVKVVYDGTVLKKGRDYTVSYKQNKNAGTAGAVVKGRGYYSGSLELKFHIAPVTLGSAAPKYSSMKYTGKARTQTKNTSVKAKVNGKSTILKYGRDYTVSYKNNVNAGKAVMIVKGKGNFKGTIKKTFQITKLPLKTAVLQYKTMKYTGKARTQTKGTKVYAVINGKRRKLAPGKDYTVSYRNNYYGRASMVIKGKGNFKGTIKKTFNITVPWGNSRTSTKSAYKDAYSRLKNNMPVNQNDPYGIVFTEFSSMITGSSVIPGIKNTHIIDRNGSHMLCHEMVMQGMCTSGDYTLVSAYCHDKIHSSVIYVMKNGTYAETIVLTRQNGEPFINHVGGMTLVDGNVYIAGSKDNCIYYVPFHTIESRLARQDARKVPVTPAFYTQKRASFLSSWQGKLYVGTFYMDDVTRAATSLSTMQCYDPYTGSALGGEITFPTNTTQGVEFIKHNNETYLLISSSYGRGNRAELISAKWDGGTGLSEYKRISIPNMSEEIAFSGGSLLVGFESAARTYMTGGFQTSIRPVDRIVAINYRSMLP